MQGAGSLLFTPASTIHQKGSCQLGSLPYRCFGPWRIRREPERAITGHRQAGQSLPVTTTQVRPRAAIRVRTSGVTATRMELNSKMRAFSQAEGRIAEDPEAGRPRSVRACTLACGSPGGNLEGWNGTAQKLSGARTRVCALPQNASGRDGICYIAQGCPHAWWNGRSRLSLSLSALCLLGSVVSVSRDLGSCTTTST